MIKIGVIQSSEIGNLTGLPNTWKESDWTHISFTDGEWSYIKSFDHYWSTAIENQFDQVFDNDNDFQDWIAEGSEITIEI